MSNSFNTSWVSNMTDEELVRHSDDALVQGEIVKRFVTIYDEEFEAALATAKARIEDLQAVLADIRNLADA